MGAPPIDPARIRVVRQGPGANCSSIGSALDVVFMSALAGAALLVTVASLFRPKGGSSDGGADDGTDGGPSDGGPSDGTDGRATDGGPSDGGPSAGASGRARGDVPSEPLPPTGDDRASPVPAAKEDIANARLEPFGAWIRVRDDLLVALDQQGARAAGLVPEGASPTAWSGKAPLPASPLEAHLAVTSRCAAGCTGCYVDARPDGESPPFEVLAHRLRELRSAGVFTVAFGGGEPLMRDDLHQLAAFARSLGLVPVLTTSGFGLGPERAATLEDFAQVNVSYDGADDDYEAVRGFRGAGAAERAMLALRDAGVAFGANVVLTQSTLPRLAHTCRTLRSLGAREAQLLRYKPSGRARDVSYLARRLSPAQVETLTDTLEAICAEVGLPLRIDCSLVPLLSGRDLDAATLERFGVLGCEAGRHLSGVTVAGRVSPCSFAPASSVELGAGSGASWPTDPMLDAWRAPLGAEPCRSCSLAPVCRGGCRVVSSHLTGALAPDPECPRVRHHVTARAEGATATL